MGRSRYIYLAPCCAGVTLDPLLLVATALLPGLLLVVLPMVLPAFLQEGRAPLSATGVLPIVLPLFIVRSKIGVEGQRIFHV